MVRASQQDLADAIGSVREVVTRNLHQLHVEGLVDTMRDEIVLLDPERLAEDARGPASGSCSDAGSRTGGRRAMGRAHAPRAQPGEVGLVEWGRPGRIRTGVTRRRLPAARCSRGR